MKHRLLLIIFLFSAFCGFAQELRQMQLLGTAEKLTDEIASRRDRDGNWAAAIQVISDMDGFSYDAFNGVVGNVDSRPGMDIVYLQTTERVLEVYRSGYEPLRLILSELGIRLQAREVWRIRISGEEPAAQSLPVIIRIDPPDASLRINNQDVSNTGTHALAIGEHRLRIAKADYKTIETTITVDEQNILFEYALERQPDALLEISSNPGGATIYLDGVRLGQTPFSDFYKPGDYTLRLVKEGYVSIENELIELKEPGIRKIYTLEENVGYLTVNTHAGATVFINDTEVPRPQNLKLPPQLIRIRVSMPKAKDIEERVVLNRDDRISLDLYPEVQTATLQLAVAPFEAEVLLTGDAGERYTSTGSKVFEDIPVGTYTIKVSAAGHETKEETVVLKSGERESRSIRLSERRVAQPAVASSDYGFEMVLVKGGSFTMGCTSEQGSDCWDNEKPTRRVRVSDYYIGKYEVTQKQWRAVMGSDPPDLYFKGCDNCPVERVSWNDIQEFIKKLNQLTGKKYRLPTEAEWEFAARGGNQSKGFKYAGSNNIDEVAWYWDNSTTSGHSIREDGKGTFPVGRKKPNELGLYDMSGNVWEWCEDDWHGSYSGAPTDGRAWVDSPRGSNRVLRGGGWNRIARRCRVSGRYSITPDGRYFSGGFRLAQSP